MPFNSDVGLLYYRADYLRKAGIEDSRYPTTGMSWPQLQLLIDSLDNKADKLPGYQRGWTTQLAAYEGLTVNVVEAFSTADVHLTDGDGHYRATVDGLRTGLDALADRVRGEYTIDSAFGSDEQKSLDDFAAGRTAFLRHWPYAYDALPRSLPSQSWQVAPLPGQAVLGGQDLAVSADSPRAKYAVDLVRFLTGRGAESCLLDAGLAATRSSAYGSDPSPCVLPEPSAPAASASPSAEGRHMPTDSRGRPAYATTTLLPALRNAVQRPRTPYYGAFTQALQTEVHKWLVAKNPPDAYTEAKTLAPLLARALAGK
jgi:multiple sugar transport system substrate-binding protein